MILSVMFPCDGERGCQFVIRLLIVGSLNGCSFGLGERLAYAPLAMVLFYYEFGCCKVIDWANVISIEGALPAGGCDMSFSYLPILLETKVRLTYASTPLAALSRPNM
jgi:hypothetical protein